nr:hypothetical protein GCM10020241_30440 [Streptoalloteichus tenebrarius]
MPLAGRLQQQRVAVRAGEVGLRLEPPGLGDVFGDVADRHGSTLTPVLDRFQADDFLAGGWRVAGPWGRADSPATGPRRGLRRCG